MQDGDQKDKKDKKGKTEHHHHHRHKQNETKVPSGPKPTGPAPTPPISLADRIVSEMHKEPLPSPASPKMSSVKSALPPQEAAKIPVIATTTDEQLGVIATFLKWIKDNVIHPTFSRQNQITRAYSDQFSQTVSAIQKRFSANDARIEELGKTQARFTRKEESATVSVVELGVTSTVPKPTIH